MAAFAGAALREQGSGGSRRSFPDSSSDVDGSSPFAAAFWMSLKGTKAPLLSGLPSMLSPSFLPECLASETTAVVSQIWCACKGYLTKASLGA